MLDHFVQVAILFFVIFDPLASFAVFFTATQKMPNDERAKIALLAVGVAGIISLVVLLFGQNLLALFNTSLDDFRVAGGVILLILGVKMSLGHSLSNLDTMKGNSSRAIAAIIGTPLLTGPAAISAIMISTVDYGTMVTGLAILLVLAFTAALFYESFRIRKFVGTTAIQVASTIFGLITLAWGVGFIRAGLGI